MHCGIVFTQGCEASTSREIADRITRAQQGIHTADSRYKRA